MASNFLTFDFGKSSIRTIVGVYDDGKLSMYEINRVPTIPLELDTHTYLNVGQYMQIIMSGMVNAAKEFGPITSLGIGFWGGVFALLDSEGKALRYPLHYSDIVFQSNRDIISRYISDDKLYLDFESGEMTGSISMLLAIRESMPEEFSKVETLLMMPDYLAYLLTGTTDSEETIISSGGLSNMYKKWNKELLNYLNLPLGIFKDSIVAPGTKYPLLPIFNTLDPQLANTGYVRIASHDTASAVSTLRLDKDTAFISSGSTSIIGINSGCSVISKDTYEGEFLNEVSADGQIRLNRNITGMTTQNNCMNYWKKSGLSVSFDETDKEIMKITDARFMVDPNDKSLSSGDNTPSAIAEYCRKTNQPIPVTPAEVLSAINTGLAMEYRNTLDTLQKITGRIISRICIVGGGLNNKPLCQFTANATGCTVITGNKEATSVGNLLMQAKAYGLFTEYDDIAKINDDSFSENYTYHPENENIWNEAYEKYLNYTR